MSYAADFRRHARICLKAAGYPEHHNALRDTSLLLNVPRHTLKRWFHQAEPLPADMNASLQPMLHYEVQRLFATLDRKREEANYAELSHALAQLLGVLQQVES